VRVRSCNAKFVDLSWVTSGDNNAPVTQFVIFYTTEEGSDQLVEAHRLNVTEDGISEGIELTTTVFTRPWVRYRFFVAARNAIGLSDRASEDEDNRPAVCFTPQTKPERNPTDVCTQLGRPHQLIITWQVMWQQHTYTLWNVIIICIYHYHSREALAKYIRRQRL